MADGLSMVHFLNNDSAARNDFLPEILASFDEPAEGEIEIPEHAIRDYELQRAEDIESNRQLAIKNLAIFSRVTEKRYEAAAARYFPAVVPILGPRPQLA